MTEAVNSDQGLEDVISLIRQSYAEFKYIDVEIKIKGKARTHKQNASLHKYCDEMAFKLNVAGVEYVEWGQYKQSKGIEVPWTMELFKGVFKDYAGAMFPEIIDKKGEPKTSKLTRKQLTEVYELVNERMSVIFGQGMQWPSIEGD